MKKFLKHALLFTVMVVCMLAIFTFAASAAELTGATEKTDAHVASFELGETTYYYTDFDTAVAEALANDAPEITVLKNADSDTTNLAAKYVSGKTLTIKGLNESVKLTLKTGKTLQVYSDGHLIIEDMILSASPEDAIVYYGTSQITFRNVDIVGVNNCSLDASGGAQATIIFDGCTITHNSGTTTSYFGWVNTGTTTFVVSNTTTNAAITKPTASGAAVLKIGTGNTFNCAEIYLKAGGSTNITEYFSDDATAKQFGCTYRIGDIPAEGGKVGEVYVRDTDYDAVYAKANTGDTIVNLVTGEVTTKQCNHQGTTTTTIPAEPATCIATGLTEGIRCECGSVITEPSVAPKLLHADTNEDGKCDKGCGKDIVAYVIKGDEYYYYTDVGDAIEAQVVTGNKVTATIYVIGQNKTIKWENAVHISTGHDITIIGEGTTLTLDMVGRTIVLDTVGGNLKFQNITLAMTEDSVVYGGKVEITLTLDSVVLKNRNGSTSNCWIDFNDGGISEATVNITNCKIEHANTGNANAYVFWAPYGTVNFVVSGLELNSALVYPGAGSTCTTINLNLKNIDKKSTHNLIRQNKDTDYEIGEEIYGNDATARYFGYNYRVGEETVGAPGVVFFKELEDAFAAAGDTKMVYDTATGNVVDCQHTPSGEGVETLAATCTTKGTRTHTCSKCSRSYTEEIDVVPHADTNGDYYCDKGCAKPLYEVYVEVNGIKEPFNTFDNALKYIRGEIDADGNALENGTPFANATIVVLKDSEVPAKTDAAVAYTNLTIKGGKADVKLSLTTKSFWLNASSVNFVDLTLKLNAADAIYTGTACDISLAFTNVTMDLAKNCTLEFIGGARVTIAINNCTIAHQQSLDSEAKPYFVALSKATATFEINGLTTNAAVFYAYGASDVNLALGGTIDVTRYQFIRGTGHKFLSTAFSSDALAKLAGMKYRLGEVTNGAMGTVYFVSIDEFVKALDANFATMGNKKLYDMSNGNAVVDIATIMDAIDPAKYPALYLAIQLNASTKDKVTVNGDYVFVVDNDAFYSTNPANDENEKDKIGSRDLMGAIELAKKFNPSFHYTTNNGGKVVKAANATAGKKVFVGIFNDAARTVAAGLKMNEAAIYVDANGNVYLLAWNDTALEVAIDALGKMIDAGLGLPKEELVKVVADADWVIIDEETGAPEGTLVGGQYVNNDSLQYVYAADKDDYLAYVEKLTETLGYTEVWTGAIGNNLFGFYKKGDKAFYVAYNEYTYEYAYTNNNIEKFLNQRCNNDATMYTRDYYSCIRVISMPAAVVADAPNAPTTYEKVADSKMVMVGLENGDVGMCYVLLLENGHFVVVDGGMDVVEDKEVSVAEAIYNAMKALKGIATDAELDEIYIDAWYLTHMHGDHIDGFEKFVSAYADKITLDYMIASIPATDSLMTVQERYDIEGVIQRIKAKIGEFDVLNVKTGQKLYFANLTIEILMTYEDHAPFNVIDSNDANTVARFNITSAGKTTSILFLGDSQIHTSQFLRNMYGSYLKSDMVQLAHHGNNGVEDLLYKFIAADYVLIPHIKATFNSNSSGNTYYADANKAALAIAKFAWAADPGAINVISFTANGVEHDYTSNLATAHTEHSNTTTGNNGTYHWTTCNDCGAILDVAEHSYTIPNSNETHHWNECACGAIGEATREAHTPAAADDHNCVTATVCTCGYEMVAAKTHDFTGEWNKDDAGHWHVCKNSGCNVTDGVEDHTGGEADCQSKAVCSVCNTAYGEVAEHKDDNKDHKCDYNCGKADMNMDKHVDSATDDDHVCDYGCKAVLEACSGGEATCQAQAVCTVCGTAYGNKAEHKDDTKDHKCDYGCGKDDMGDEHKAAEGTHICNYCNQSASVCVDNNPKDGVCDICGENFTHTCADEDKDHACDRCGAEMNMDQHKDSATDKDHVCDYGCGVVLEDHSGGAATCTEKAVCEVCGASYGPEPTHAYGELVPAADAKHTATELKGAVAAHYHCDACDKYFTDAKVETTLAALTSTAPTHNTANKGNNTVVHWDICSVCGLEQNVAEHTGGTATCIAKAVCTECETAYGELADHNYGELISKDEVHTEDRLEAAVKAHYHCDVCDGYFDEDKNGPVDYETFVETAPTHDYATAKFNATEHWNECSCGKKGVVEAHKGGTADCQNKAVCEVCDQAYGEKDLTKHVFDIVNGYTGADGHANTCKCGEVDTVVAHTPNIEAATETQAKVCTVCNYEIEAMIGHVHADHLTAVEEQDSTCTTDGYKAYYKCSCGNFYEDEAATKQIANLENWKANAGKIAAGHKYGDLIEAEDAIHTIDELKAGVDAHYHCVCGKYFTEDKVETTLEELTGETPVHEFGGWVTTDSDRHWKECECGMKVDLGAHVYSNIFLDETCNTCGHVREITHVHGSKVEKFEGKAATETEAGYKEYYRCECGYYYADEACTVRIEDVEAWKNGEGRLIPLGEIVLTPEEFGDEVADIFDVITSTNSPIVIIKQATRFVTAVIGLLTKIFG